MNKVRSRLSNDPSKNDSPEGEDVIEEGLGQLPKKI